MQARALNSGPSPSAAWVEAGAVTHKRLKKPRPTINSSFLSDGKSAAGLEKAFLLPDAKVVALAVMETNSIKVMSSRNCMAIELLFQ